MAAAESEPRLVTLAISPFNDFARWSLERAAIPYREERHAMGIHRLASRRAGGRGTTPVLIAPDGEVAPESPDICEWADRHAAPGRKLYPEGEAGGEARAMVRRFVDELGPPARRIVWQHMINDLSLPNRYWSVGIPDWERRMQPILLRVAKPAIRQAIKPGKKHAAEAAVIVGRHLDEVAERLADGRRHLFGDELTAPDICFAAMCVPALIPPEGHPVPLPPIEAFPPEVAAQIEGFRAHPAGQFALRLYREGRRAPAPAVAQAGPA